MRSATRSLSLKDGRPSRVRPGLSSKAGSRAPWRRCEAGGSRYSRTPWRSSGPEPDGANREAAMSTPGIEEDLLERMVRAVEKVRERLRRAAGALEAANIPYAVIGGNAVAAWVARVDESAVRN